MRALSGTDGPAPVLLFDGDCGFCSRCAELIERRIPTSARVIPWQRADLDALGVSRSAAAGAVQWIPPQGPVAEGPAAVVELLRDAGGVWSSLGWLLARPPARWIAGPLYRLVARHRHRLPGGTPACALPPHAGNQAGSGRRP